MSRIVLMPRTAAELIKGATCVFLLIVIVVIMGLYGIHQSSTTTLDNSSKEAMKNTENNFILGMVILGILSTFGTIAYYYYRNIDFGSKK